jgi:hypothetical protein
MPNGRYAVLDDDGSVAGRERFRSAPGPMGWRYFSEIDDETDPEHREVVDVAVDRDWRIARTRIYTGDHDLLLEPRGSTLRGYLDGREIELPFGPGDHLDYFTPATNAITCRRLGATSEVDVLYLAPRTLEPTRERQRYDLHGPEDIETPAGRFLATRWTFTDLASGWTADLWMAGDTVVKYERLFELEWYEPGASGVGPIA